MFSKKKGFSGLYSVILVMLQTFHEKLIESSNEELLCFIINDITKSSFFDNSNVKKFNKELSKVVVEDDLLETLTEEYNFILSLKKDK